MTMCMLERYLLIAFIDVAESRHFEMHWTLSAENWTVYRSPNAESNDILRTAEYAG